MQRLLNLTSVLAVFCAVFAASGGAVGGTQFHGIAFNKGCQSPTNIGDPYLCAYQILNVADTAHDTLTITSIVDNVHAFGGDVSQGNILSSLTLQLSGGAFCDNTPVNGLGTGNTICTIPFGGSILTAPLSQYTPTGADFANLPNHTLTDTANLTWQDTCVPSDATPPSSNCSPGINLIAQGTSSSLLVQLGSSTATQIHNAAHQVVTSVPAGSVVHDFVTVTGQAGNPFPTGNVTIDWFTNGTCAGNPASTSGNIALNASGEVDAIGFSKGPLSAGAYSFKAHYLGDSTYTASDGPCEPLEVVGAPPSADERTPGYWRNHQSQTTALLPITLGVYTVDTFAKATAVFDGMNCGLAKLQGSVGCLAGHLLAAKLNVANGADTCISPVIGLADLFLVSIGYTGPSGTYSLTTNQRLFSLMLKNALDKYNNGKGC